MSHTPGKWQMHDEDYCPQEIYGDLEGPMEDGKIHGTLVCTVEGDDEELVRANAKLIRAAPCLLDALLIVSMCSPVNQDLNAMPDDQEISLTFVVEDLKIIRKAVAYAKGS